MKLAPVAVATIAMHRALEKGRGRSASCSGWSGPDPSWATDVDGASLASGFSDTGGIVLFSAPIEKNDPKSLRDLLEDPTRELVPLSPCPVILRTRKRECVTNLRTQAGTSLKGPKLEPISELGTAADPKRRLHVGMPPYLEPGNPPGIYYLTGVSLGPVPDRAPARV